MATKKLSELQKVFELMGEAYFFKTLPELTTTADILTLADFEMPVSEEGVALNVGDPDITRKKITAGINWITFAKRSDDDMTMQVPSYDDSLNELFLTKKGAAKSVKVGDDTYEGSAYSLAPKKFKGAWVFRNPEHTIVVILPNTENYATFKGPAGDSEGYYNVSMTSLGDADSADIIILHKKTAAA